MVNAAQNDDRLRKYQESLRILERDEKLLRAREQVLRWLVGRLCLAAQGQSTGLDAALGPKGGRASSLPQGLQGGPQVSDQPVLPGLGLPANGAKVLALVDGAEATDAEIAAMERVWVLFDGNDHPPLVQRLTDDAQARRLIAAPLGDGVPARTAAACSRFRVAPAGRTSGMSSEIWVPVPRSRASTATTTRARRSGIRCSMMGGVAWTMSAVPEPRMVSRTGTARRALRTPTRDSRARRPRSRARGRSALPPSRGRPGAGRPRRP